MKRLKEKYVQEFAKTYIGSQMSVIDGSSLGGIPDMVSPEDLGRIVKAINYKGERILGNRKYCSDPEQILVNLLVD